MLLFLPGGLGCPYHKLHACPHRVGRWINVDPKYFYGPNFSPYINTFDNPIRSNDKDGKWPEVTYLYFEGGIGAGFGYGVYAIEQTGLAYDKVGKTHFTMSNFIYVKNQNLQEGSNNPQYLTGGDVGLSAAAKQDYGSYTFLQSIGMPSIEWGSGLSIEANGKISEPSLKAAFGVGFVIGNHSFGVTAGISAGFKISNIGTEVKESISLTDREAGVVNDATDLWREPWIVTDKHYDEKTGLWSATVSTRNKHDKLIPTGIVIQSANVVDEKGNNIPLGIWVSPQYLQEARAVENKGKQ